MVDNLHREAPGSLPPPEYLRQWAALLNDTSERFAPEALRLEAWAYRLEAQEKKKENVSW